MTSANSRRVLLFLVASLAATGVCLANWTATGTFRYQDREFNATGFTGSQPNLPIRFATVEIRDLSANGGQQLLATGATDGSGNFTIAVVDGSTKTRSIVARVLSQSTAVTGLYISVTNVNGQLSNYAVTSATFPHSNPNLNLNLGTTTAAIGAGGEAFNLYDVGYNSLDYLRVLTGSYPGSADPLALRWEFFSGFNATSFLGSGVIRVGDISAYNDTVVAHESGHYAREVYSATDSPGGIHHLSDCTQDLRLAWEEGYATFFGQAVRRQFNLPNPQLYVKTTGQPGAGNLDFYFDLEDEYPYSCQGAASEVTVYSTLWDMIDSPSTPDGSPGIEDDILSVADSLTWDVFGNYLPGATNRTLEDFWDGWFLRNHGLLTAMRQVFADHGVEYVEDAYEPNEVPAQALSVPTNGFPYHQTYFHDQGNGAGGTADADYFTFAGLQGVLYTIETRTLLSDANTSLILYGPDGTTVLKSNDDRTPTDRSSQIDFLCAANGIYFVKSFHGSGFGVYGSYDFKITSNVITSGGSLVPPIPVPSTHTTVLDIEGQYLK